MTSRWLQSGWAPFALCTSLTVVASVYVGRSEHAAQRARFENHALSVTDHVRERMASYMGVMRAASGFVAGMDEVSREDFRLFVDHLELPTRYRGTQGIGYTARFDAVSAAAATEQARSRGWDVQVWPDTQRDEVHAIVLLEPLDERNRAALGYDMRTEETRRTAMDHARDHAEISLSGKVTLVQEIEHLKQPGFLLYSPVYDGQSIPPTVAERRAQLRGYVYAPLRAGDLFDGVFGDEHPQVAYELYDGASVDEGSLLYTFGRRIDGEDKPLTKTLTIGGRTWTARFVPASTTFAAYIAAVETATLGGLLSIVVMLLTRARDRGRERYLRTKATLEAKEESLRLKDMFVGVLGHDLVNPLNAIGLTTQQLGRHLREDERGAALVQRIQNSANRMIRMIGQVVDLTRAQLGSGIRVESRDMNLDEVVKDVADEAVRANGGGVVEVVAHGDCGGAWDPDRLAQVASNIIANAIAYRGDRPVTIDVDGRAADCVVLKVHNATAIPPGILPNVFDPFRGSDTTPRRGRAGLGLGLYITREIVVAHGGTVEVTSNDADGTTFTVSLPRPPRATKADDVQRQVFGTPQMAI